MTATALPSVPPDDGSPEVARWYALEGARSWGPGVLAELHQTERIETGCLFCEATFDGTFREGREWFAEHRAREHPDGS